MTENLVTNEIQLIIFSGLLAVLVNWAAWRNNFFKFKEDKGHKSDLPVFGQVATVFAIYIAMSLIVAPLLVRMFLFFMPEPNQVAMLSYLQLLVFGITLAIICIFSFLQNRTTFLKIWKNPDQPEKKSIPFDFGLGVMTWFISFPLVVFIGQIGDLLIYLFFKVENYEQVAVRYLKMTMASPLMFIIALFSVIILAPILEELLFRGFLQSWLKRHVGTKGAIALAGLAFALFHLDKSQGVGNIALCMSLFSLACYLGFIYERQGSLFASIGMHMTFNVVSTLRIFFFEGA